MTAPTLRGVGGELAADDPRPQSPSPPVAINDPATTPSGRRRWRALVGCLLVALAGIEAGLVGPDLAGALRAVSGANAGWLLVATVMAAASMSMFARARCRLLCAAGVVVTLRGCVAAVYAANSLHATLPGGGAFSTGYSFRWMRGQGASRVVATWCLAANGLVSTGCLVALGLLGSLLAQGGASAVRLTMEITSVLVLAMSARYFGRRLDRVVVAGRWVLTRVNRVRHRHCAAGADLLAEWVTQLRSVQSSGRDWTVATGFALLNWAFDAGCLAACAAAVSVHGLTLALLLVAYTAGMASSGLSLVPGGIGVVEPALVLALVAGGIPAAAALPAVVLYRLISLVGVVAAGWIVFAVQQWRCHPVTAEAASSQHDARDQPVSTSLQRPNPPSGTGHPPSTNDGRLPADNSTVRSVPVLGGARPGSRGSPAQGAAPCRAASIRGGIEASGMPHTHTGALKRRAQKWLTVHRYEQF
ncbi:MAG: flippase-like domain-containing protein [Pseudonocardiales bacterium]|nr:flippase-like domain-containing protein [Pseudonocardiales bacterium]